jgi:hypothetical protein
MNMRIALGNCSITVAGRGPPYNMRSSFVNDIIQKNAFNVTKVDIAKH